MFFLIGDSSILSFDVAPKSQTASNNVHFLTGWIQRWLPLVRNSFRMYGSVIREGMNESKRHPEKGNLTTEIRLFLGND